MTFDYVVIGKGLVGSAAAKYLSASSRRVAIIGPDEPTEWCTHPGPFSSHYDQGRITRVLDPDPVWALLAKRSISEYGGIERASGIAFHHPAGVLRVAPSGLDKLDRDEMTDIAAVGRGFQVEFEVLEPPGVRDACPQLHFPDGHAGMLEKGGAGYVNPRALIEAQVRISAVQGTSVIRGTIAAIRLTREVVELHTDGGDTYQARKVLVATGAYADQLLDRRLDLRLIARTILLAELPEVEAARLRDIPAVLYRLNQTPTVESIYMVPPVRYPDGKPYLKIGGLHSPSLTLGSHAELHQWFSGGSHVAEARVEVEALKDVLLSLVPKLEATAFHYKPCVTAYTEGNYPVIDTLEPGRLFVAAGGCGASAKSSNEIGRLAAVLVQNDEWTDGAYEKSLFASRRQDQG